MQWLDGLRSDVGAGRRARSTGDQNRVVVVMIQTPKESHRDQSVTLQYVKFFATYRWRVLGRQRKKAGSPGFSHCWERGKGSEMILEMMMQVQVRESE